MKLIIVIFMPFAMLMAGCATSPSSRDFQDGRKLIAAGEIEQGLAQIEHASKAEPYNTEYRETLFRQRELAVNKMIVEAEAARARGEYDAAENAFRRVLALDAGNPHAREGMDGVKADRRRRDGVSQAQSMLDKGDIGGAKSMLADILAEDPKQQDALALEKHIDEAAAQNAKISPVLDSAFGKKITLEFQDANLKSVFDVISRVSGLNFVFDKDVNPAQKATIFVKNTSIKDAVKVLLVTNQLEESVLDANTVLIYPNTAAKNRDYQELVVKSFYLSNADVKVTLEMIKTILKAKDVFTDEKLNLIVIRDTADVVNLAAKLIAAEDLAQPEVVLDLEVLEVSTDHLSNLGTQFPQQIGASLGTAGTFTLNQWRNRNSNMVTFKVTDPALALNLKKTDTDTKLLANPRIRVKDREKAKIHIGQRLPVITSIVSGTTATTSESVNYIDVGLKLDVQPTIRLDEQVDMKVELEVSNVLQTITLPSGSQVYTLGTRNASTSLRLKDGETQVLAGLIQNNETSAVNKLPGFGDIPLLGKLFSSDNADKTKTELVLLITPHIVRNVTRPDAIYGEFPAGTENAVGDVPVSQSVTTVETRPEAPQPAPAASAPVAPAVRRVRQ
ncbi:MAG: general secretion pathway protein GspD [Burkholderiales bacterium]|nr:general secretion pathway protein GspD [Burkholderiales bacterium]